jgi:diguanylate cyclase (GGDEF)-like protein
MKSRKPIESFAPHEIQRFILPITLSSIVIMSGLIAGSLPSRSFRLGLVFYSLFLIVCTIINHIVLVHTTNFRATYGWPNAIFSGIGLGLLPYFLPTDLHEVTHILIPFGVIAVAILSGRAYGYTTLLGALAVGAPFGIYMLSEAVNLLHFGMPFIISFIFLEVVLQIKNTTQLHIHRLQTINNVSRQFMLSLDTQQTLALLDTTIQETLEADTYFIGLLREDEIHLDLFYDDGQYFNGARIPLRGTLSGWVIENQRELFMPDLRKDVELEGIGTITIGGERSNLSWMGVPLTAPNIRGVISLGSYQPNAFDAADLELLASLAQHITLALDNTIHHAQVEEQARLDSLTSVYNHGYFLKKLAEHAQESAAANVPLSLIMMDIDFFKQYNDTYGHLVGDRVLKTLCAAIKHHIKHSDAVGRWGGEEFVVSLPGATGLQALQVAERIGQTMAALKIEDREERTIPVPTVSQGIAVYPIEADEIYRLIDLADRRLYSAKARGRNQIEPSISHWEEVIGKQHDIPQT